MTYNPAELDKYLGITVLTRNGSLYGITEDGEFSGRPNCEGAKIAYAAGLDPQMQPNFSRTRAMHKVEFLEEYGQEIRPGLCLTVIFTPESAKATGRDFFYTSPVEKMSYRGRIVTK
jgi:hypothetical protein